jgi:hypothetical protein
MTPWGISRWAYEELRAFCRQYPEKRKQADMLLGLSAHGNIETYHKQEGEKQVEYGVVMPRGGNTSDPTASTVFKRDRYLADCDLIDRIAKAVDNGGWENALILNCCYGTGYEVIDPAVLPNSNRNAFFQARREFFFRLYEAKYGETHFDTPGAVKT